MNNWIIKISFWLLFIGTMPRLSAQFVLPPITAEATDLAHIKAAYNQTSAVSCNTTYLLFAPSSNRTADSMTGHLTLFGNDYHFKIAHFEYLQQGERLLYVDHENHEMQVFKTAKSNANASNAGQIATLLDREGVATSVKNLGGNKRKLTWDAAQAGISNIEIWYNTDNYFIERTRMVMPETKGVLEVKYGAFSPEKTGFNHSIAAFAVLKNKKYTPTDKYKGYKIKATE